MPNDPLAKIEQQYDNLMSMVTDDKRIESKRRKNCKLCNSEFVDEAEAIYEFKHNAADVIRFLSTKGEDISPSATRNHLSFHWKSKQTAIAVKEYADSLSDYMKVKKDKKSAIHTTIDMLMKEQLEIIALSQHLPVIERRKSAELAAKLTASILSCYDAEDKIDGEIRPIHVFIEKFNTIIQNQQENASPEVKQKFADVVNTLYNEVGDIVIDKK